MKPSPLLHHVSTPALARMYQQALDKQHPAAERIADELARRLAVQREQITTDAARLGEALAHLDEVL